MQERQVHVISGQMTGQKASIHRVKYSATLDCMVSKLLYGS